VTTRTSLDDLQAKAAAVHEALPWIKRLSGRTVVVKYGGAAMGTAGFDAFVDDVVLLRYVGVDVIVVHGGGPEVSQLMARFGKEPVFVDGHRVTDAETMDLARMVLVGRVNKTLVGRINTHGRLAVGLSGEDGLLLVARPRVDPGGRDLGFVGDVAAVDPTAMRALTDKGLVPVVATVAAGPDGQPYNVNADAAAGSLAAALGAEKLVYLTDVEGLYADLDDPGSLLEQLTVDQVEAILAEGRVAAGMVPKLSGFGRRCVGGFAGRTFSMGGGSMRCCLSCSPTLGSGPWCPRVKRRWRHEQPARAGGGGAVADLCAASGGVRAGAGSSAVGRAGA
jgi:acetylglutamate kinase